MDDLIINLKIVDERYALSENYTLRYQSIICNYFCFNIPWKMKTIFAQIRLNRFRLYIDRYYVNLQNNFCTRCGLHSDNLKIHILNECQFGDNLRLILFKIKNPSEILYAYSLSPKSLLNLINIYIRYVST